MENFVLTYRKASISDVINVSSETRSVTKTIRTLVYINHINYSYDVNIVIHDD